MLARASTGAEAAKLSEQLSALEPPPVPAAPEQVKAPRKKRAMTTAEQADALGMGVLTEAQMDLPALKSLIVKNAPELKHMIRSIRQPEAAELLHALRNEAIAEGGAVRMPAEAQLREIFAKRRKPCP